MAMSRVVGDLVIRHTVTPNFLAKWVKFPLVPSLDYSTPAASKRKIV